MRKILIAAVLAAAVAVPLAAQTTTTPAAPAAAAPAQQQIGNTPEDRARGGLIFRVFSIALNSDKVQPGVKARLSSCLYNTPMRNISVATGNVFAKNDKLDPKNPQHVYAVAARLCGVKPDAAAAAPGATPTPKPTSSPAASGR